MTPEQQAARAAFIARPSAKGMSDEQKAYCWALAAHQLANEAAAAEMKAIPEPPDNPSDEAADRAAVNAYCERYAEADKRAGTGEPQAWSATEPERAGLTPERNGSDGKPRPRWYMPAIRKAEPVNRGAEFDESERRAAVGEERRKGGSKPQFEGSRQMADRLDKEAQGEETETKEQDE